jgi:sugar O-acyltransferase (sialic acid O-acetyltransferase NeuD family)
MPRDLIILGSGVHGAEMVEIVERINHAEPTWNLLGFLSPHVGQHGLARNGVRVLGPPEAIEDYPSAMFITDNEWKLQLPPRERLASLIDPSAFVSQTVSIGAGCVIYPNSFIGLNATLGDCVFCLSGCIINHDCVVEDNVVMASGVVLAGSVMVEQKCYLGQSCSVKQKLRIGRGSTIGMGAVVIRDVPPGTVVVGNPGRILLKPRDE